MRKGARIKRFTIQKIIRFDNATNDMLKKNVQKKAERTGKKISESKYIRELVRRDNIETVGIDIEELKKMRGIMAGCGNNLNQIAKKMNMYAFNDEDYAAVRLATDEIDEIKNRLRKIEGLLGKE